MKSYVLEQIALLKDKKFMQSLCVSGIEVDAFSKDLNKGAFSRVRLYTNQNLHIGRWLRKWLKRSST